MITPVIIEALFRIGSVVCVLAGLGSILTGLKSTYGGSTTVLTGLLILVLGSLGVRVWCELLILFFRMKETLTDIRNSLAAPKGPAA